jgi:DNA polymerase III alpha subunit (gram-positive type)
MTPNFKTKISRKSLQLNSDKKIPDFMTRLERDVKRRSSTDQEYEVIHVQQENVENTFKPKINQKAELLRSRSSFEMSYGDQLRHDTKLKMLKLQNEQSQLADATFKPKISTKAKEIGRSKLQLNDDPSHFLSWINEKKKDQELQRQHEMKKREEEELKGCTFKPNTTECPAYIKRIAESISKMKSARGNGMKVTAKPEWK